MAWVLDRNLSEEPCSEPRGQVGQVRKGVAHYARSARATEASEQDEWHGPH